MTALIAVNLDRVSVTLTEPVRFGSRMASWREVGILHLVAADGTEGIGEVALDLAGDHGAQQAASLHTVLVGLEPGDWSALDDRLARLPGDTRADRAVRSAIEMAMLDLIGRGSGRPVAEVLGATRGAVPVNALLTASAGSDRDLAELAAAAESLARGGFRTVKVKRQFDAPDPVATMRAVRSAVGPDVALRLDLNGDLGEDAALELLPRLAELDLEYVEQPVDPALGAAALARVRRQTGVPIAADESVEDSAAAAALLAEGAVDVLVLKPTRVGGPRQALAIARTAAAVGVRTTISTFYETGVGLAAALHLAAAIPGDHAHGLATGALLEDDLVVEPLSVVDGRIDLPAGAGLGVELDRGAVDRLRAAAIAREPR